MGLGRYQSGRFHLIASLRHDADKARIDEWKASFVHASRMLFEATDGQHQIGTLTFCNNTTAGGIADIWLEAPTGESSSGHGGIGHPGVFAHLWGDERRKPFIVLHELGHFLYHLHDEYESASTSGSACIGGSTADACIMEGSATDGDRFDNVGQLVVGRMRRFCVASNHDPDQDTRQHRNHHESCWETMGGRGLDLDVPVNLPIGAGAQGVQPPSFLQLTSVPRFAVVLDRSGSMIGEKLRQAKVGAHFFVDNASNGDELAQISFASAATVDLARHVVEEDRDIEGFTIDNLTAQGETSIGDGLRRGMEQIASAPAGSAVQTIVLITDGLQTHGEDPSTVIPDLVRTLTRVYAVGVGPNIDDALLQGVASQTGGEFARIDPSLPEDDQAFGLRSAMERFAVQARDGGAVTDGSAEAMTDGRRIARSTVIEQGAGVATFVLSWRNPKDRFDLALVSPSGELVTAVSNNPSVRVIRPDRPYVAVKIKNPESGRWSVRLFCRTSQSEAKVQRWTFVENTALIVALGVPSTPVARGDRVGVTFSVAYKRLLTGVRLSGRLTGPEGQRIVRFRAGSFDAESEGEYSSSLLAPEKPGVYTLAVSVSNDRSRTRYASFERIRESIPTPPIPDFTRQFTASLLVR